MSIKRRQIREKVLQALYAHELSGESVDLILEHIVAPLKKEPEVFELAKQLILKTIEVKGELDALIKGRVANWEFNRLAVIDRIILRMGICELLYFEDIPPKVSINEAIEIARRYSTEKSDKFVNGVLDSILADLKKGDRVKKTGRGLLETSTKKKPIA
ncbi:MAG: transcription antitermination factor NusB [Ignavibacteriales bacterium]|nr:transcription antitermination factor NusB [Ignavibacteriales bacterium]